MVKGLGFRVECYGAALAIFVKDERVKDGTGVHGPALDFRIQGSGFRV
jgi:hypothetical protein